MLNYYNIAEKNEFGETEIAWLVAERKEEVIKNHFIRTDNHINMRENLALKNNDIFSIGAVTFNAPYAYFLYKKASEFQEQMPRNLRQADKLKYIYAYLSTHINYRWWLNENAENKNREYRGPYNCLFKNSGVCSEISDTFQLLCRINNINCTPVCCNVYNAYGNLITEHQLNKILLDNGRYTFCDVTAEITKGKWRAAPALKKPNYNYFCKNADFFKGRGYSTAGTYYQYFYIDKDKNRVDIPVANRSYQCHNTELYQGKKIMHEIKHTKGDFELPSQNLDSTLAKTM